ncbi:alpha/beta fold hydrolase [Mucilaginibacter psychrotolerans]|uniref:Alpha/beta hydrolase n=1 Tax=Mucilaginibacter psychrotolerans TaxID=1524096 RepID=A0A4Y8S879_9SPHI|nr:alpha/beta hydrolase [Mucilaginibacter psychrotolerans]TFF34644.1 alpha/beta hydrolase [Mucilaginibacter psychrotolerans]
MKTIRLLPLLAICAIFFTCNNPQPKTVKIATPSPIEVKNNGVHIDYTDTGKSDTTLLFVHGWCINKTYWAQQVAYFGKRYRVVTMDLAGYGQSGHNRDNWSTIAFANDVNAVIDQLKLKKVVLIGHSMSGDIVLQAAIDAPDKVIGLVGVDNFKGQGAPPQTDAQKKEIAEAIAAMRKDFKKVSFQWFNEGLFSKNTSEPIKDRILNDVAHADTVVAAASMEQQAYDELPALIKLKKKLYLINSDYQPTDTAWLVKQKLPFMLLEVHGTGHFPMVEAPVEFNLQLDKVLVNMNR